ncbi:MAG: hypothetical protein C0623_12555 [Desulfuromonas sp.]|nr:MAG: hypothetical protein C0623_12555 [Desulfuromonas sp.]
MEWTEIIIYLGILAAILLFGDNISRHFKLYRGCGIGLKIFIIYIEIIKAVGGTFLTLLWIASCLFLHEGIIDFFGGRGILVSVVMLLPICVVFYMLLLGFTRLMDAFPEMMHQNNSDHDE